MAVSLCKWGSLLPWWAIGFRGIYRGRIHSSTRRWSMKTLRQFSDKIRTRVTVDFVYGFYY